MFGIRLFAVTHQTESLDLIRDVWHDDEAILMDQEQALFRAMGDRRASCCDVCCSLCTVISRFRASEKELQAKGQQTGNYKGDGLLLGGVWVVGPGDGEIVFEHREQQLGEICDPAEVLDACSRHLGS
eukprot:TRINITY_DN51715_c0_g1_i2.p1 TRINITY_DN51715_c0_g1~~TRINITY_DN51715_c0_g1_i2.p1  ORF type:complete len:128 (+),score=27.77 TRINITY_DN51715_c0_g1_i2:379-762(+)